MITELRINNYCYCQGEIRQVFGISKDVVVQYINKKGDVYYCGTDELKPIQLTEEILLNCGFEKIDYHRFKIKPTEFEFYYTISIKDNCFREYVDNCIICLNTIFYLHQLQNLYFALTNEELIINL